MRQYHDLLQAIITKGSYKEAAREGMPGTTALFGYQNRYDLAEGFPILTTKKIYWKGIVAELLWFLRGDTNIKFLDDHKVTKMWHQDAYNYYVAKCKQHSLFEMSFDSFQQAIKDGARMEKLTSLHNGTILNYQLGDCGFQYGRVWRAWDTGRNLVIGHNGTHNEWGREVIDQIARVINSIKKGPYGRRHIVTAIDPAHDEELALYWCHALFQFNCRRMTREQRKKWAEDHNIDLSHGMFPIEVPEFFLDCQLYQRSADVILGVPFNISSYCLLTHMIAKIVNMVPGDFVHTFGDVHIYDNHKEAAAEQLGRDVNKYKLPKLELGGDWSTLGEGYNFNEFTIDDFKLVGYESYPKLESETELSTGMKK